MSGIDPSKATPQAAPALRVGSKGFARRQKAAMRGEQYIPAAQADDDEDEEDDADPKSSERDGAKAIAEKDSALEASVAASAKYTAALEACRGNDGAAAHLAAEDAGDETGAAHATFKAASMSMRGVAAEDAPPPPAPPVPPGASAAAVARAVVAVAGPSADAQLELTRDAALGKKLRALFGGAPHDETEGLARAALADAADAKGLRASAAKVEKMQRKLAVSAAETALRAEVAAAVRAGKYTRAELADVTEGVDKDGKAVENWTPKGWLREMAPAARASMIAAKQARVGTGGVLPDETPIGISAAVRAYGEARGYSETQIAALAAQLSVTNTGASAPSQEVRP